jgi:hypothetical protein
MSTTPLLMVSRRPAAVSTLPHHEVAVGDARQVVDRPDADPAGHDRDRHAVIGDGRPSRLQRFYRGVGHDFGALDRASVEMIDHPGPHARVHRNRPELLEIRDRHPRRRRHVDGQTRIGS